MYKENKKLLKQDFIEGKNTKKFSLEIYNGK